MPYYDNDVRLDESLRTELGERAFSQLVVENMAWKDGHVSWVWTVNFRPTGQPSHSVWGHDLELATKAA